MEKIAKEFHLTRCTKIPDALKKKKKVKNIYEKERISQFTNMTKVKMEQI